MSIRWTYPVLEADRSINMRELRSVGGARIRVLTCGSLVISFIEHTFLEEALYSME